MKTKEKGWSDFNTEGQEWAEVNIPVAITSVKTFVNKSGYILKGQLLKKYVREHFNENRIIELFIQDLKKFYGAE